MKYLRSLVALSVASSLLAACGQSQYAPPTPQSVNNGSSSYSKLQFAVGTANINGQIDLNVVSMMRQPNGLTADLVNSPSITMPFSLSGQPADSNGGGPDGFSDAFGSGPSPSEVTGNTLTSTPQSTHLGAPVCPTVGPGCAVANVTTFGLSGGVGSMGLGPNNNTTSSTAYSYTMYPQPIFASAATQANFSGSQFTPWGGPPAFDDNSNGMGVRDGLHNLASGALGYFTGITIFEFTGVTAANMAGTYKMNVVVPTGPSTNATESASASMTAATLPAVAAPALTSDGKGGGTFNVTLPAGATEGYIQVIDLGQGGAATCQGILGTETAPVYYTIKVVPGTTSYTLPDTIGPNSSTTSGPSTLTPSPSICSGDQYQTQFIAMDYPLFEAFNPTNKQQAPNIVGASGQDDITVSPYSATATY